MCNFVNSIIFGRIITRTHYPFLSNILQWENDEKNASAGAWNDFSNFPLESGNPTFSMRHGKSAQVGRMDGSAARIPSASMLAWANDNSAPNDLWYSPNSANGH
jgi:hypothetical protein